LKEDDEGETA